jgi:hypothetical protein
MADEQATSTERIREGWEGDDPRYCIEPLQPRKDVVIGDEQMVIVEYPVEAVQ